MAADRVGNTFNRAKRVSLNATPRSFSDSIGGKDRDFYRYRASELSTFSLQLTGLSANANVVLYDRRGDEIARSARRGRRAESIQKQLDTGVYYVLVFPQRPRDNTAYTLTMALDPVATNASPFNIEFDYRFDTSGWFTPERKAALEVAATIWETIIQDDFANTPVGTVTPFVTNPQTGQDVSGDFTTDRVIDDVLVFVGARNLQTTGGSTLALSGPSGYFIGESRYDGSDFEPWIGSMAFNTTTNWFFDATPDTDTDIPASATDFITTAAHEIAHVLGFGTSVAFDQLTTSLEFTGAATRSRNGGSALPLSNSAHILTSYRFGGSGETLMAPTIADGVRKRPTVLDLAPLEDIGYQINYSAAGTNAGLQSRSSAGTGSNSHRQTAALTAVYGACGCSGCLVKSRAAVRPS